MIEHKHLIVRAEVANPPIKERLDVLEDWLKSLVEGLGMKILAGPYTAYADMEGNRGATGVCIIETSHIVIHVWDEDTPALVQLDVYTCGKLNLDFIRKHFRKFDPIKFEYIVLDRKYNLDLEYKGREHMKIYGGGLF